LLQANISCLAIAAAQGHLDVVEYLCSQGNDQLMACKTNKGNSPLALAKHTGRAAVVEYLESVGMQS
jgi:ankyrin repeat protein